MINKLILFLTASPDPHVARVDGVLKKRGIQTLRLDSNTTSEKQQIEFTFQFQPHFSIVQNGRRVSLSNIRSMWYRKPQLWFTKYFRISPQEALAIDFKRLEVNQAYKEIMISGVDSGIFQVSNIESLARANNKLNQLIVAGRMGFAVPKSLVTSSEEKMASFIKQHGGEVVIKNLKSTEVRYGFLEKSFFTYSLRLKEFNKWRKLAAFDYPVFLQEKIKKQFELRITVIGRRVLACSLDSQSHSEGRIDWRRVDERKIKHELFKLPAKIEKQCLALCSYYGLQFGAIDMAVTPDGKFVFFEINPNGQYLWIENLTGITLSEFMADLLMDPRKYSLPSLG